MGLRDDLQADLAEAYDDPDGLADAIKPFECVRTTAAGEYDWESGTTPVVTSGYRGRGVFGSFKQQEIDGALILATDTKLSAVLQNELIEVVDGEPTGALVVPQVDDVINGMVVKSVGQDPASVTWTMALRRT
ncbi:hypothetical protein [Vreelandella populi]|uniref:hypothetical protein n=1 Tax=Vreelandella populi TaxID=2498858 RepID=UPI000F8F0A72|nr:hypothetical protein [Halomonas populi]RUR52698.1 hypothetical protein ELY40_11650 [Halomonas populi]